MLNHRSKSTANLFLGLGILALLSVGVSFTAFVDRWQVPLAALFLVGGLTIWRARLQQRQPVVAAVDRSQLQARVEEVRLAIAKVPDPLGRTSLAERLASLLSELSQERFRIVTFGGRGVGKTAAIRALLGKNDALAETGKPRQEYNYTHKSARQIVLIDMPGKSDDDATAWQSAIAAHAILFITSGDLTASEYLKLEQLAAAGKRVVLAFNQSDRYLPNDREAILKRLRACTEKFLAPIDVVAIAAQPLPMKIRQHKENAVVREWWEPVPADIGALKDRLEAILTAEWEPLLIGNALLQLQAIATDAKMHLNQHRRTEAEKVVTRYQWAKATTVFASPLPAIDLMATTALDAHLLVELAKIYERTLNPSQAQKILKIVAQSLVELGCLEVATTAIAACLKTNVATYAVGGLVQAIGTAYLTRLGSESFIAYLESETGADAWRNPEPIQAMCRRVFASMQGREFFQKLVAGFMANLRASPV